MCLYACKDHERRIGIIVFSTIITSCNVAFHAFRSKKNIEVKDADDDNSDDSSDDRHQVAAERQRQLRQQREAEVRLDEKSRAPASGKRIRGAGVPEESDGDSDSADDVRAIEHVSDHWCASTFWRFISGRFFHK